MYSNKNLSELTLCLSIFSKNSQGFFAQNALSKHLKLFHSQAVDHCG